MKRLGTELTGVSFIQLRNHKRILLAFPFVTFWVFKPDYPAINFVKV
jgi:hypothetical protein